MLVSILFPSVCISGANALAGHAATGYPALTAFCGWAHTLARLAAGASDGRYLSRFAILHHTGHARLYGKYRDKLTQKRAVFADQSGNKPSGSRFSMWFTPSEDIRPQVDLEISLLIEADIPEPRRSWLLDHAGSLLAMPQALGGHIRSHGKPRLAADPWDLLNRARRGFFICDRTSLLFPGTGRDPLDVLLDYLDGTITYQNEAGGRERLFMAHTGYLGLSPAALRTHARGDVLHRHAEPVFGLGSFVPKFCLDEGMPVMWRPVIDEQKNTYLIKGESL